MGRWEEVLHTADLALHVWGEDLADLFRTAAQGMFSLLAEGGSGGRSRATVALTAGDVEGLLVDWLNELLYLHERDGALFTEIVFTTLTPTALEAEVTGCALAQRRAHIKAVTYHMVGVSQRNGGYETEIVFDV
ncbi:MAG: archease [Anaerolineae bacterium]|nr:archease [Anaerolineae bacterium]